MSLPSRIATLAASYGYYADSAKHYAARGMASDARWYAKHARAGLRELLHLTGQPTPAAHRTADSFS